MKGKGRIDMTRAERLWVIVVMVIVFGGIVLTIVSRNYNAVKTEVVPDSLIKKVSLSGHEPKELAGGSGSRSRRRGEGNTQQNKKEVKDSVKVKKSGKKTVVRGNHEVMPKYSQRDYTDGL